MDQIQREAIERMCIEQYRLGFCDAMFHRNKQRDKLLDFCYQCGYDDAVAWQTKKSFDPIIRPV